MYVNNQEATTQYDPNSGIRANGFAGNYMKGEVSNEAMAAAANSNSPLSRLVANTAMDPRLLDSRRDFRKYGQSLGINNLSRREWRAVQDSMRVGAGQDKRHSWERRAGRAQRAIENIPGEYVGTVVDQYGKPQAIYSGAGAVTGNYYTTHYGMDNGGLYENAVNGYGKSVKDQNIQNSYDHGIDASKTYLLQQKVDQDKAAQAQEVKNLWDSKLQALGKPVGQLSDIEKTNLYNDLFTEFNQTDNWARKLALKTYLSALDPTSAKNLPTENEEDILSSYMPFVNNLPAKQVQDVMKSQYTQDPVTGLWKLISNFIPTQKINFNKNGGEIEMMQNGNQLSNKQKAQQKILTGALIVLARQRLEKKGTKPTPENQNKEMQKIQEEVKNKKQETLAALQNITENAKPEQLAQIADAAMQTPMAKFGTKLSYIKSLTSPCKEGEDLVYFKKGGKFCKACMQKAQKNCGGAKVAKAQEGQPLDIQRAQYLRKSFPVGTDTLGDPVYMTGRDLDKSYLGYQLRHEQRQPMYDYNPTQGYIIRPETSDEAIERKGGDYLYKDFDLMDIITTPEKYYDPQSGLYKVRPDWNQEQAEQEALDFQQYGRVPERLRKRK